MTTTKTKTSILSKVKLENIVQISLSQSYLEQNFKAILQALEDNDQGLLTASSKIQTNSEQIKILSQKTENTQKQNDMLKHTIEQLKEMLKNHGIFENSQQKISTTLGKNLNPEQSQNQTNLKNLQSLIEKLSQKTEKLQLKAEKNGNNENKLNQQIQKLKKQISQKNSNNDKLLQELKEQIAQLNKTTNQNSKKLNQSKKNQQKFLNLAKQIQELSKQLNNFIQNEYTPFHTTVNDKFEELQKMLNLTKQELEEEKRMNKKLSEEVWNINDNNYRGEQAKILGQINEDNIKMLKKQIAELNKKLNQLSSLRKDKDKISTMQDTTSVFERTGRLLDTSQNKNNKNELEDLRNQMLERLKDQRSQLLKMLKRLDFKSGEGSQDDKRRMDAIEESILRVDHILGDKADLESMKKLLNFLENKINYLFKLLQGKDNEEDAIIGRKNWFCLSCDKNLEKYSGKIGSHLPINQLKSKILDQDNVGGGMTLKPSKSKVDLPHVKNLISKKI